MAEEWERKRISTNPFLYTDGSLVEPDVLQAQITDADTESSTVVASMDDISGDTGRDNDVMCSESGGNTNISDPDHTPQVEAPRQTWTHARPGSRIVSSIDIDDEKV